MQAFEAALERNRQRDLHAFLPSRPQKRRQTAASGEFVFQRFRGVFSTETLDLARDLYRIRRAEVVVLQRAVATGTLYLGAVGLHGQRVLTTADGRFVDRGGRVDALLAATEVLESLVDDEVYDLMTRGVELDPNVRTLLVDRATAAQNWHTDLPGPESGKATYATLVVALETVEEGATEFAVRREVVEREDHDGLMPATGLTVVSDDLNDSAFDVSADQIYAPRLRANEGLLFDGRIVHRGGATSRARAPVIYMVFRRPEEEDENV